MATDNDELKRRLVADAANWVPFSPSVVYDPPSDRLTFYWDGEADYTIPIKRADGDYIGEVLVDHKSQTAFGATVYGVRRLLEQAGFAVVKIPAPDPALPECASCREHHAPESVCPPHEVRSH